MEVHLMFSMFSNLASDLVGYNSLRDIFPAGLAQVLAGLYGFESQSESDLFLPEHRNNPKLQSVNTAFIKDCLKDKIPKNDYAAMHRLALLVAADVIESYSLSVNLEQLRSITILAAAIDAKHMAFEDLKLTDREVIGALKLAFDSETPLQTLSDTAYTSDDLRVFLTECIKARTGSLNTKSTVITPALPEHNELSRFTEMLEGKLAHIITTEQDKLTIWKAHISSTARGNFEAEALTETLESLNANKDYASFRHTIERPDPDESDGELYQFYDTESTTYGQFEVLKYVEQIHEKIHVGKPYVKQSMSDILMRLISDSTENIPDNRDLELFFLFKFRNYFSGSWIATLTELSKSTQIPRSSYFRFFGVASFTLLTSPPANHGAENLAHKLAVLDLFALHLAKLSDQGITDHSSFFELMFLTVVTNFSCIDETKKCNVITPAPFDLPNKNWVALSILSVWYSQSTGKALPENVFETLHVSAPPAETPYFAQNTQEHSHRNICVEVVDLFSELIELHNKGEQSPLVTLIARHSTYTSSAQKIWHEGGLTTDARLIWTLQNLIAPGLNLNIEQAQSFDKAIANSSKTGFESATLLFASLNLNPDLLLKPLLCYGQSGMKHILSKVMLRAIIGRNINPAFWNEDSQDKLLEAAYTVNGEHDTPLSLDKHTASLRFFYDLSKGFSADLIDFETLSEHISRHTSDNNEKHLLLLGCALSESIYKAVIAPTKIENIHTLILFALAGQNSSNLQDSPLVKKAIEAAAAALDTDVDQLTNAPLNVAMKTIAPDFKPNKVEDILYNYSPIKTWKQAFSHALTSHVILNSITTSICCITVGYSILMLLHIPVTSLAVIAAFTCLLCLNLLTQWLGTKYISNQLNKALTDDPFSATTLCQKIIYPNQHTAGKDTQETLSSTPLSRPTA